MVTNWSQDRPTLGLHRVPKSQLVYIPWSRRVEPRPAKTKMVVNRAPSTALGFSPSPQKGRSTQTHTPLIFFFLFFAPEFLYFYVSFSSGPTHRSAVSLRNVLRISVTPMTLGLTDSFPPFDFQGLKQKEAVQSGSVSWVSRLVVGLCIGITGICLVCIGYCILYLSKKTLHSLLIGVFSTSYVANIIHKLRSSC